MSQSTSVVGALYDLCFLRKARAQAGMEQSISERMWKVYALHLSKSRVAYRWS